MRGSARARVAKEAQLDRQQGKLSLLDQAEWEHELSKSAIAKTKSEDAERKRQLSESRKKSKVSKVYAKGDD
jgi:hypothetical protein